MNIDDKKLLKSLLRKLMDSKLAKGDGVIYRTAKGLLMRLMR